MLLTPGLFPTLNYFWCMVSICFPREFDSTTSVQESTIRSVRSCYPEKPEYEYVLWDSAFTYILVSFPSRPVSRQLWLTSLSSLLPRYIVSVHSLIFDQVFWLSIIGQSGWGAPIYKWEFYESVWTGYCYRYDTTLSLCYHVLYHISFCVATFKVKSPHIYLNLISTLIWSLHWDIILCFCNLPNTTFVFCHAVEKSHLMGHGNAQEHWVRTLWKWKRKTHCQAELKKGCSSFNQSIYW